MPKSALVIGGAGAVGTGIVASLRDAGYAVCVVDPAGDEVAAEASAGLLDRVDGVQLAVVSLPARGRGRAASEFRPAEAAAEVLPARLDALTGGAALARSQGDEAALIGSWQRRIRSGLDGAGGIRAILCAVTCFVEPVERRSMGERIREVAESEHPGGMCRIDAPDRPAEWVD
jgi:NAD(P)-dependent dehydrogenase (short-subunit alcohol dehydrogenase family)